MTSDVVLSSALRTNLLSLQNTQRLIDDTQLKLATGLSVNSALDSPQNFFAAQSLDNRAGDLSRLLDGIGQSIRTIEEADNGIEALTALVEQAESIATSALEATNSAAESSSITGNVDVSGFETGVNTNSLTFTATNAEGQDVALTGGAITLALGATETDIVNSINAIRDGDNQQVFEASVTDSGRLQIETTSQLNFNLEIRDDDGSATAAGSQTLAAQLGFGQQARVIDSAAANSGVSVSLRASSAVTSGSLYTGTAGNEVIAARSATLDSLVRDRDTATGNTRDEVFELTAGASAGNEQYSINVAINGVAAVPISVDATTTIQGLVDSINGDSVLNTQIEASYDEDTGQISLAALNGEVDSIELSVSAQDADGETGTGIAIDFGFSVGTSAISTGPLAGGLNATTAADTDTVTSAQQSIRVSGEAGELAQLENDFNTLREQIDTLVGDASYRGVNLLNGDNLTTTFDESRENTLTTEGVDFTTTGLGVEEGLFTNTSTIQNTLDQTRDALLDVRNFGQSIANDLAIIQTRRDFTESTIQTLEAGADDLTVADQNEEGANLLALQTRQQLGVTSLSLASQSQQAVLRLF